MLISSAFSPLGAEVVSLLSVVNFKLLLDHLRVFGCGLIWRFWVVSLYILSDLRQEVSASDFSTGIHCAGIAVELLFPAALSRGSQRKFGVCGVLFSSLGTSVGLMELLSANTES